MDKPISVGDLVVVLRGSTCVNKCKGGGSVGLIFKVAQIRMSNGRFCVECDAQKPDATIADPHDGTGLIFTLDRLKRIPPLDELEGEKRDEEITA